MPDTIVIILLILGIPVGLVTWLVVRAISARKQIGELSRRVDQLVIEVIQLQAGGTRAAATKPEPAKPIAAEVPGVRPIELTAAAGAPEPKAAVPSAAKTEPTAPIAPPLLPVPPLRPPLPPQPPRPPKAPLPAINWEQFLGVKGFAWLGGLALFLGVAFFIKYSFDNNLVSPQLRVAMGFITGIGLLTGGVLLHQRRQYTIGAQTLCATGVVVLYAVTFACRARYHFLSWPGVWWDAIPAFALMALITATGFLLSIRLNAMVVALLGMLGGFLTPILLSTGQDNPFGLFGYIAFLDAGLIFVALNRRWHFLTSLAALGTVVMQIAWAGTFFVSEKYFDGNKILIPLAVLAGFNVFFLGASWLARRREFTNPWLSGSNLGLAAVALGFTVYFIDFAPLAQRPVLIFSFMFLIDLAVHALTRLDERVLAARPITGLAAFGILGLWTMQHLTGAQLNAALGIYFVFAVFHSVLPVLRERMHGAPATTVQRLHQLFPPLALLLVLLPIFKLEELSFLVWPFVLLVDLLAIGLAVLSATLLPVLVVLVLTLAATGALLFKIPSDFTGLPPSFFLLGGFAVFFVAASVWLLRKFKPGAFKTGAKLTGEVNPNEAIAALLPACSVILPFLLLIMTVLRLPMANPSPVFGLALLLVVLLLGLARIFEHDWLPVTGLVSVFALECAWHFNRLDLENPNLISPKLLLGWYLVFLAAFAGFPFLFTRRLADKTQTWAAAALAGPAQFLLIHRLVAVAWPNSVMGLIPAAFAVPSLLSLVAVLKTLPEGKPRMTILAWFGGVALFFVTLIFPIQFDRQWITLGWGLEGAALLWLFHRLPHPGLRLTGIGLLVAAFVRLAINPAVLEYHARTATPIFNWYLYTYGIVTVALFAGARLLAPPRQEVLKSNAQAILASLGTVLAFLLLNIEIADYFSTRGSTLTFQFSGNFARDMTYSIAWAVFALVLLVAGIVRRLAPVRHAGMVLLCVTLLKLFLHDLARLGPLYRIGAFMGVAVIAIIASLAYQRFFAAKESVDEPQGGGDAEGGTELKMQN
jgi:uncharacterized membrane protein